MCGICGKFYFDPARSVDGALIERMMDTIGHRGPDGRGKHVAGPVGLGHTRLSIIDLSSGGQPITNEDGTIWIVYNGEIYNFRELREDLVKRGHTFRTTSDTEVIVHLYEEYGVECLGRLKGMFAFALWDDRQKLLFCARDRIGIKPFYFANTGSALIFGSEIKALLVDGEFPRRVNRQAIDRFLTFSYVPGRDTLMDGIHKLEPGHYLLVRGSQVACSSYWDLKFGSEPTGVPLEDASNELKTMVRRVVREHMVSDVPVGVLLSGGVDSTIILECAARESNRRINTFTVGFERAGFEDERPYARMAAQRFGSEHHEITISSREFSSFLGKYVWHMEEPVYEPPAVALYYVSTLARQHVKVVLSGEGGDEAFGGYQTYRNLLLLERFKSAVGPSVCAALSIVQKMQGNGTLARRLRKYGPLLTAPLSDYYYSRRSSPFAYFAKARARLYTENMRSGVDPDDAAKFVRSLFGRVQGQAILNQMLYVDTKTWLPDDLLVKADKMTMASSVELRVPFLDHEILEFAASLPPDYKVSGWETKRILKSAFADEIPAPILKRRKAGFPVPIESWIEGDLKDFVHDHLLSERSLSRGYFERAELQRMLAGRGSVGFTYQEVFSLLMLELWHRQFVDRDGGSESSGVQH